MLSLNNFVTLITLQKPSSLVQILNQISELTRANDVTVTGKRGWNCSK